MGGALSRALVLLFLSTTAALRFVGLEKDLRSRRSLLASLAPPTVLIAAAAPAHAMSLPGNPLTTLSRMDSATKRARLTETEAEEVKASTIQEQLPPAEAYAPSASPASAPAATIEEEAAPEATLKTQAGLAQIDVQLNVGYGYADEGNIAQLRQLLRSPIFAEFLGFRPKEPNYDRQVELLQTFPARSQREAAQTLVQLNTQLKQLDETLEKAYFDRAVASTGEAAEAAKDAAAPPPPSLSPAVLTAAVSEARSVARAFTALYSPDGCMVCADNPSKTKEQVREEYEASKRKALKEANDEISSRLLRRPDGPTGGAVARQGDFS